MKKIFFCALVTLHFILCQAHARDSEDQITTYIEYASAWTGDGLAKDINDKLDKLYYSAEQSKQCLRVKDIKITPELGYAFILYEISPAISEMIPIRTYVQYASAWTGSGLTKDISGHLDRLQRTAEQEKQYLYIKDIKITPKWSKLVPEWGYAFIIYEIAASG